MLRTEEFSLIYEQLKPHVIQVTKGSLTTDSIHLTMTKAALMKCFEFNLFILEQSLSQYSFFNVAIMRGICEDLITLKYLNECFEELDIQEYLSILSVDDFQDSIKIQKNFFKAYRAMQPIINTNSIFKKVSDSKEDKRIELQKKYGWKRKYPSAKEMAAKCGLIALYDYLYSATSKTVHFKPQVLMRMGWGNTEELSSNSVKHFSTYHANFGRFYGSFLFIEFFNTFKHYLNLPVEMNELLEQLKKLLNNEVRWPEVITFEEMNVLKPHILDYVIYRDPNIMGGTIIFAGTHVPLKELFNYLKSGHTLDEFIEHFPSVNREQATIVLRELSKEENEEILAAFENFLYA